METMDKVLTQVQLNSSVKLFFLSVSLGSGIDPAVKNKKEKMHNMFLY